MNSPDVSYADRVMPGFPATIAVPVLRPGRFLRGAAILLLSLDGAITFVPWPIVTTMMDRLGYGSSECVARLLGAINLMCAFPPASFVGAIVAAGYLGSAMVSYIEIGGALFMFKLCGVCLGALLWGDRGCVTGTHMLHG
jgi:hypothetical protein